PPAAGLRPSPPAARPGEAARSTFCRPTHAGTPAGGSRATGARRRQALDEAVLQRPHLAVDPVEVLEDREDQLHFEIDQQLTNTEALDWISLASLADRYWSSAR